MNIVLVNQYFWPDMAATAQLLADLGEDLAARGHEVTVLTGRGSYARATDEPLPARETWHGVAVRRVWCTDFGRGNAFARLADYLTFLVSVTAALLFGRRHDVAVFLSTPPLLSVLGLLARRRGMRFVYKVEDLYPDVAVALGAFPANSLTATLSGRLSATLLRRAEAVVALDQSMGQVLTARGAGRVQVIPNWADGRAIRPDREAGASFGRANGLNGRFVVLYSGNLGLAHRFDAVVDAARALAGREPNVLFLFVGAGPRLAEVRLSATGLENVRFMPYQGREGLCAAFNAGDIHLVSLRDEVAGLLFPSKYPAALAAGRPVLLVGGRGTALRREIEGEALGWCCDHDPGAIAGAVRAASMDPECLSQMGSRGRRLFEERYERRVCTARWAELLEGVLE